MLQADLNFKLISIINQKIKDNNQDSTILEVVNEYHFKIINLVEENF